MNRPVSPDFIQAMEEKLEHGRNKNRWEWETQQLELSGPNALIDRLNEEVSELEDACERLNGDFNSSESFIKAIQKVRQEAADVANFAMFIADSVDALK